MLQGSGNCLPLPLQIQLKMSLIKWGKRYRGNQTNLCQFLRYLLCYKMSLSEELILQGGSTWGAALTANMYQKLLARQGGGVFLDAELS